MARCPMRMAAQLEHLPRSLSQANETHQPPAPPGRGCLQGLPPDRWRPLCSEASSALAPAAAAAPPQAPPPETCAASGCERWGAWLRVRGAGSSTGRHAMCMQQAQTLNGSLGWRAQGGKSKVSRGSSCRFWPAISAWRAAGSEALEEGTTDDAHDAASAWRRRRRTHSSSSWGLRHEAARSLPSA